ncbi:EamA-like transporter family [Seminavis robusta]|uniref:EamA-like transporter family n=1 Tax=Seminavis robusta TaxID=568900 RepID=A0A9N8DZQ0_9STRA|nr:EamA-like transporter family [Seminavis robusta]|eukprot:Sro507_g156530.1 EamA-like transporter family (474) ;mRNA; r:34356-35777
MSFGLGIVAALAAPLTMTLGFIVWDNHWTGSAFALNMFKCNLASIWFVVLSATTRDDPFSAQVFTGDSVGFLMLSSAIGILVGDFAWLEALRLLGARKVIVMDSLKPFLAAVFGWALLGEQLQWAALGGIACTVVGILLVSLEDRQTQEDDNEEAEQEEVVLQSVMNSDKHDAQLLANQKDTDFSTRTDVTTLVDRSTLSLATGSFPPEEPAVDDNCVDVLIDPTTETNLPDAQLEIRQEQQNSHDDDDGIEPQSRSTAVVDETRPSTNSTKRAQSEWDFFYGYGMAIINVLLDTYGSVLTKEHGTKFTTWEINLVRFGFAGVVMLFCSIFLQTRDWFVGCSSSSSSNNEPDVDNTGRTNSDEEQGSPSTETETVGAIAWYKLPVDSMSVAAWLHVSGGVLFVTFFTPALSNYALFQIALALALTLGSIGPLYALPLTYLLQKDQAMPSLQAGGGAVLAVAGILILAFWGTLE